MRIGWNEGEIIHVPSGKPVFLCQRDGYPWKPCRSAHHHNLGDKIKINPALTPEEVALVDEQMSE